MLGLADTDADTDERVDEHRRPDTSHQHSDQHACPADEHADSHAVFKASDALSPAKIWLGLASANDNGLRLDLRTDVLINGSTVGTGELDGVRIPTGDFKSTMLNTISLALTNGPAPLPPGAQFQLRVSARRACSGNGPASGTARLWYNGAAIDKGPNADAGSRFDATIGGGNSDYFLRTGFSLATTAGASRTLIDELLDSSVPCPGRPFTAFGTWSITP